MSRAYILPHRNQIDISSGFSEQTAEIISISTYLQIRDKFEFLRDHFKELRRDGVLVAIELQA
jgi:hypothetical protein